MEGKTGGTHGSATQGAGGGKRLARQGWLVGRAAGLLGRKAGLQGKKEKKKMGCCWATRGVGLKANKEKDREGRRFRNGFKQ
jgi:hypothetical protein